jgi:hypothetical protein
MLYSSPTRLSTPMGLGRYAFSFFPNSNNTLFLGAYARVLWIKIKFILAFSSLMPQE